MKRMCITYFFNDTATTEIYTLSLHDALPICHLRRLGHLPVRRPGDAGDGRRGPARVLVGLRRRRARQRPHRPARVRHRRALRSEEHTSELQSRQYLVCRLLLEKKKITSLSSPSPTTPLPTHLPHDRVKPIYSHVFLSTKFPPHSSSWRLILPPAPTLTSHRSTT